MRSVRSEAKIQEICFYSRRQLEVHKSPGSPRKSRTFASISGDRDSQ